MRVRLRRRLLTTLIAAAAVIGLAATANADHIRVMVVQQDPSTSNSNGYTVGLRVDFNYSGNCCGGYFSFNTGEGRTGGMPDGISNGQPDPDVTNWTTSSFSYAGTRPANEQTFRWRRYHPDPAVMLIRIDIEYDYPAQGTYVVAWDDCCPQSNGGVSLVAVTGAPSPAPSHKILTFSQVGSTTWTDALEQAQIQPCTATPVPVCYDVVSPASFSFLSSAAAQAYLQRYKVLFLGTNADFPTQAALNTANARQGISNWAQNNSGGIVAYAQNGALGFGWLPNLGGTGVVTATPVGGPDSADLTVAGAAHSSHRNQLPAAGGNPSTLADWGPSVQHAFTAWPSYLGGPAAALAVDGGGSLNRALSLAGTIGSTLAPGCAFITGQPVDERAVVGGVIAAQQLVRSSLNYAISCDPLKLGVIP